MRNRERGIGNLPFIAVLVLFVIAVALFFMSKDEADQYKAQRDTERQTSKNLRDQVLNARDAFDAWVEVSGYTAADLRRDGDNYPDPDAIKSTVREALFKVAQDTQKASEAKVLGRTFNFAAGDGVEVIKGDPNTIRLFGIPFAKETVTVQGLLAKLPQQFSYAAAAVSENNKLYEQEFDSAKARVAQLEQANKDIDGRYQTEVQNKQQQLDSIRGEKDDLQNQVNTLSATNDTLQTSWSTAKEQADKDMRTANRDKQAWMNRALAEKQKKEIALAEDPKDGEVLLADARTGLAYLNLGRRNKVATGTKFKVWRPGKGNVRENVALVRVIDVDLTKSTARVLELYNSRVPVTRGMNISNPFYDPQATLKVYIYGDLKKYPTDVAKRRLADSDVHVSDSLDDTVNVIVLGEPPVTVSEEVEEEGEAAAAEAKAAMERDRRLREVLETAAAIGAIVVTENVLSSFVDF